MAKKVRRGSANGRIKGFITPEGGHAEFHTNKTGAASVGGQVVKYGAIDGSVIVTAASEAQPLGVVYNADWNIGVADGEEIAIVTSGDAYVLLEDTTGATAGNWVKTSDTDVGRADATLAAPPGGGIPELDQHMRELGHAEETVTGGTDVLCKVHLHPN